MSNEKRGPTSPERLRTPEEREQLKIQFLDAVNELIAATDEDRQMLRRLYQTEDSPFRFYKIGGITDWMSNITVSSFSFEKKDEGGGWLGYQLDDELHVLPVDWGHFSIGTVQRLLSNFIEKWEVPRDLSDFRGFTNAQEPAVLQSEKAAGYDEPRQGYYERKQKGVIQPLRRGQSPDHEYARRAAEKAAPIRERMETEQQREEEARIAAERADQIQLVERVRQLKREHERLAEERRRQDEELKTKESPVRMLGKALDQLHEQMIRGRPDARKINQRLGELGYKFPSLDSRSQEYVGSLGALGRLRESAERTRSQLGWVEKKLSAGKAADAYLTEAIGRLADNALEKARQAEADLVQTRERFDGEDKRAYEQAREALERKAGEMSAEVDRYFKTPHEKTRAVPTPLEFWGQEGLRGWLEECRKREEERERAKRRRE